MVTSTADQPFRSGNGSNQLRFWMHRLPLHSCYLDLRDRIPTFTHPDELASLVLMQMKRYWTGVYTTNYCMSMLYYVLTSSTAQLGSVYQYIQYATTVLFQAVLALRSIVWTEFFPAMVWLVGLNYLW